MDPLTAALNAISVAITLASKVWDATPKEQQTVAAGDWAKFTHNIGAFLTSVQDKINAVAVAK
jgi:hypothetical protein